MSFDESRGVYHCHGAGCDFSGGAGKLACELGLTRPLSAGERREIWRNQQRADRAARDLYERVKARRFELSEEVRGLGRMELQGHEAGMSHPAAWEALALVYRKRPTLLAELTILENCGAADLIRFLCAGLELPEQVVDGVLTAGGLYDSRSVRRDSVVSWYPDEVAEPRQEGMRDERAAPAENTGQDQKPGKGRTENRNRPTVKILPLSGLILDEQNANRGSERGRKMLADSLRKLGAGRSVLVDHRGRVIAGNKTVETALRLGLKQIAVIETDGETLVAVRREDLDLKTDKRAIELAVADNRVAASASSAS